jgi:YegS/Rv2252/BmrU family lipid kinase
MYYFIVNPNSNHGYGGCLWKKLKHQLDVMGVEYEALLTEKPGDATDYARRLTGHCREPRILVAVGGDGTINEIVDGLTFEGPITIGYIPAGTGNDLARSLHLPAGWKKCLKIVLNPRYQKMMDYGILSYGKNAPVHRRFMVSCGIGMDAAVCHCILKTENRRRRFPLQQGRISYMLNGIRELMKCNPVKGYLILDGSRKVEFNHIHFISAHIHPYEGGGFCFAPGADGCDGLLEVCVVHGRARILLVPMLLGAWLGRSPRGRHIRRYSCHDLQVHVERSLPVHVDGESCFYQTDITLGCVEKKVRFMV